MYMSQSNGATYYDPAAMRGGNPAADEMAAAKKRIQELTEGRATTLANDPYQKSVMDFLQGVTNGNNVPFTNEVQGAMLAQQGRGSAAAEAAQMEQMRQSLGASGGSIYDPAYQSAAREAMSQRQGRNLDAQGQMQAMAGRENFNARMAGAGGLAQARNAQNAQVNQLGLAGAGYRAMESREVGGGGGGFSGAPASNPGGNRGGPDQTWDAAWKAASAGSGQYQQLPMSRGSGTPTAPTQPTTRPGGTIIPENDPQTDAEKKRAGSYRLADIKAGTGPYAPNYQPRY